MKSIMQKHSQSNAICRRSTTSSYKAYGSLTDSTYAFVAPNPSSATRILTPSQPALEFLTAPTLIPTFPEDILSTLLDHAQGEEEILPLAYFQTVQPALSTPSVRRKYFQYLAQHNITEAYFFLRRQPEHEHRPFLEILIQEALHSKHQHSEDEKAQKALELIELPLTEEEEQWLESYLLEGKGRNLHGAKDTVTVRRMATGKMIDALNEAKHLSGRRIDGVSWDGLKEGMGRGAGRRRDMQVFKMP